MTHLIRISNLAVDDGQEITVQSHRQDIAPGEPGALMAEVTLRAAESALFELHEGGAIVIRQEKARG